MSHSQNIIRIKSVYNALGKLKDDVVFVGGATVSLYAERQTQEIRPTDDVDLLIEIWTHQEYARIEEQLRSIGFRNDIESGVVCRYVIEDIVVDVMATQPSVLGFSNKWYAEGYLHSVPYEIEAGCLVRIFSAPYFIATKLETFKSPSRRNANNGLFSSDFEDIVFILENRISVWEEMEHAPKNVKTYLKAEFKIWLAHPDFAEWIDAHAGYGSPPVTNFILSNLEKFTNS